jgi:hypothetical protein
MIGRSNAIIKTAFSGPVCLPPVFQPYFRRKPADHASENPVTFRPFPPNFENNHPNRLPNPFRLAIENAIHPRLNSTMDCMPASRHTNPYIIILRFV